MPANGKQILKIPDSILHDPRYERQCWMPSIGNEGQKKLFSASVLVIGAGGLGSPVLYYLAASGVGRIGIADHDIVSLSNLNRQILYNMNDIGQLKTSSAKKKLNALNPLISITEHQVYLDKQNISSIMADYDFIVDATDNYPSRYLISDNCIREKKPLFFGAVSSWSGMFFSRIPSSNHACFRCLYPVPLESKLAEEEKQKGIVGVTPGLIGTLIASQIIQHICQGHHGFLGRFLWVDLEKGTMVSYAANKNKNCRCNTLI